MTPAERKKAQEACKHGMFVRSDEVGLGFSLKCLKCGAKERFADHADWRRAYDKGAGLFRHRSIS